MTILVFDSGIGGLSVLREARMLMPAARFVYVADDAAFPFGDWREEALLAHLIGLFGQLIDRFKPSQIVIACNTASTLAISALRQNYPDTPFVGTVPAIKPAAERTRSGIVAVLATPGTVTRQYTHDLIGRYAPQCHVHLVGSRVLAALAEEYVRGGFVDEASIAREIAPCFVELEGRRTDIVVLACTHYPFLVNRMRKMAPWPVDWIDTSEAIARRAHSLAGDCPAPPCAEGDVAWFSSGSPDAAIRRLLSGFGLRLTA